jgi:hypothetical protein
VADRTIVLATNKRHAVRGLTVTNPQEFAAYHEENDELTYVVDMSSYLDGATISSITRTATGVVVSNTSNTTTRITQRLKGFGHVDFKVTTSSGDIEEFRIKIQPRAGSAFFLPNIASVPQNTAQFFATVAEAAATNPANTVNYIWTSGNTVAADGYGGVWAYTATAPAHSQYFQTANGRNYERAAWGGAFTPRGAFVDTGSIWPNGANVWRLTDRLFMGSAVGADGISTEGGQNTFIAEDGGLNSFYLERSAQILATSPWGGIGGTFASKASLRYSYLGYSQWISGEVVVAGAKRGRAGRLYTTAAGGTCGATAPSHTSGSVSDGGVTWTFDGYSHHVPIGLAAACDRDTDDGENAWAIYAETVRRSGAGTCFIAEWDIKNKGSDVLNDPYNHLNPGSTIGLWLAAGGDSTLGAPTNPSTAAIVIGKNATTWNAGIVFDEDGLTSSGGLRTAISMAQSTRLAWYVSTTNVGADIYSTVSSTSATVRQIFANDQIRLQSRGKDVLIANNSLAAAPANWAVVEASSTGNDVIYRAGGDDSNVGVQLKPKGSGASKLADSNGAIKVAADTTGIGFFAATPSAKATITGAKGGNVALANLLTELAAKGLITDSTT